MYNLANRIEYLCGLFLRRGCGLMAEGGAPQQDSHSSPPPDADKDADGGSVYECNICLDTAKDAVVSMCGHLFW